MKLQKELNLLSVFCITSGAMMSAGLFLLPGPAYALAGPSVLVSYFLAGLLAATGMLSQAELASAMPKAGGTYFFVTRSMGGAVGTVYGFTTFLALAFKSSFELTAMAVFTSLIVDLDVRIIASVLCVVFILINLAGVKGAGRIQVFLVFIIISALVLYVVRGVPMIAAARFEPFAPRGSASMLSTAGFVFISYGGLLKIASLAEEVKDPGRTLPLGMILSLLVVTGVYMATIFTTIGLLSPEAMSGTLRPVSEGAGISMGSWGTIVLSVVAILGFTSATNASVMGASRYPLALSRDRMFPSVFGRVNHRFRTPHYSILLTGAFIIGALFLGLEFLVKAASTVLILTYVFSCLAHIVMRESGLQNYQPQFRAPLYPWVQIAGILGFGALLVEIGLSTAVLIGVLVAAGLFVYWFYGRIREQKEYALLHLVERITAKELTGHSLEEEFKQIIHQRDDIEKDEFDSVIERCEVLDVEEAMDAERFFELAAGVLSARLLTDEDEMLKLLLKREKESSTVISPGLAIPHVIIKGEHKFEALIARSREGIRFSCTDEPVHALFVLAGTKDERNIHLKALAFIAQIVMDPHFEKRWMAARSKEALRDVILLGKRKR